MFGTKFHTYGLVFRGLAEAREFMAAVLAQITRIHRKKALLMHLFRKLVVALKDLARL